MREIKPICNNGSIQIKFSFGGKRHSFNPIPGGKFDNKRDLQTAQAIATRIQNDILAGNFDPTLERYRLVPKNTAAHNNLGRSKPSNLLELWDAWVEFLDLPAATKANDYATVRSAIAKANPSLTSTDWLTNAKIAASTYNKRLGYLRACLRWGMRSLLIGANPYDNLKARSHKTEPIKPFTASEIRLIISGFEAIAPHYVPFVSFLLATGVRTSEAIGLRWCHVDFIRSEIIIKESMPKDRTGNGYKRVRKSTKTGNVRHLPLSPKLREMLLALKSTKLDPDSLIFTSPRGYAIDNDNFREDYWAKVLKAVGVPYRKLYNTRHTLISHAIEQGIPITGVAYLAGHKDTRMVMTTYGHMVNRPGLPEMPI